MSNHGWIGVDLDGTLAHYDGWKGVDHIGEPVPAMLARVKQWLAEGHDVRIFTARVCISARYAAVAPSTCMEDGSRSARGWCVITAYINAWLEKHLGRTLPITNEKDLAMVQLWDDRCVQVVPNTGARVDGQP